MKELPAPSDPLAVEAYPDATVMPVTPYPQPRRAQAFRYGVFDSRGRVVRQSLLFRSYGKIGFAAELEPSRRSDPGSVVFAGRLAPHFGHFILESLSRLWYAKDQPELPIVWACPAANPDLELKRWQRELLEVLGVRNEVRLVARPTRFARVTVPQAGYRIKDFLSDRQAAFLRVYPRRPRDPDQKLWLTRAGAAFAHGSIHARRLDRELASHGWTIVEPERLRIREQLELLATAGRVAGEEGSAFHLLALLSDVTGLQVDILCRRPDRPVEKQNANYQTIATAIGLQQRLHVVPDELVLAERWGRVSKIATTLAGHLETVGITRDASASSSPSGAAAQLAADIASVVSPGSYLDVGSDVTAVPNRPSAELSRPAAELRHVVRPAYATDPRLSQSAQQRLFEMPPEDYFAYCAEPYRAFDLISIDAPGAPGLLRRWFVASRGHAHAGTTWVLSCHMRDIADLVGPSLRTQAVPTPQGACTLVLGPRADASVAEPVGPY